MKNANTTYDTENPKNPLSSRSVIEPEQPDHSKDQHQSVADEQNKPRICIARSTLWYDCVLRVEGASERTREVLGRFLKTDNQGETLLDCEEITPMPDDIRSYYASLEAYHDKKSDPQWLKDFHGERIRLCDKYDFSSDPSWWKVRHWSTYEALKVRIEPEGFFFVTEENRGLNLVSELAAKAGEPLLLSWSNLLHVECGYLRFDEHGSIREHRRFEIKEAPAWLHAALGAPSILLTAVYGCDLDYGRSPEPIRDKE